MNRKIILTIFSGRRRYLEILNKYTDSLLDNKLIDQVHFWEFTTNEDDILYAKNKCSIDTRYKIFFPPNPSDKIWGHYYNYYSTKLNDTDIIIKCDDDIVYIDISKFQDFINSVKDDGLYFPNIVNNDVCAYFQQKNNIHNLLNSYNISERKLLSKGDTNPLTGWYTNYDKANQIHKMFLENMDRFHINDKNIMEYSNRISINFFAVTGKYSKKVFKDIPLRFCNDEEYFAKIIPTFETFKLNLSLTVVHFQFNYQNGTLLDSQYLNKYNDLSNKILL